MTEILPSDLVGLPWHWVGPERKSDSDGNEWWQLTIIELRDFLVAAESRNMVLADAAEALESYLDSFVDTPSWPLLPQGIVLDGLDPVRAAIRAAEVAGAETIPPKRLEFAA